MEPLQEIAKNSILENPIRLGIMLYILPRGRALFINIQKVLQITPGNLDSHLRTLRREGYVKIKKVIADRPRTMIEITDKGAKETRRYLEKLKDAD